MDRVKGGFVLAEGIVRNTQEFTLHPSQAETANGQTGAFDVSNNIEGLLVVDITAVSGASPTINFTLETKDFLSGKWVAIPGVTIAQQTAAGTVAVGVTNYGETVRLRWVVGGTSPSFTFTAGLTAKS